MSLWEKLEALDDTADDVRHIARRLMRDDRYPGIKREDAKYILQELTSDLRRLETAADRLVVALRELAEAEEKDGQ